MLDTPPIGSAHEIILVIAGGEHGWLACRDIQQKVISPPCRSVFGRCNQIASVYVASAYIAYFPLVALSPVSPQRIHSYDIPSTPSHHRIFGKG